MKLDTEFVKLPLLFDIEQLRKEISQFAEEDWMPHATGYPGNLSIPLISLNGEYNDAMHGPMKTTPALAKCPYIQQIMTNFGEVFSRSRLMRLEAGCEVPPHIDINHHWYYRVRIHVPVTTTEDVLFYVGDRHVHMGAGEAWIFDSWQEHTVKNNSDKTRVHLVLDTTGSPRFWEMVEQGEWPLADRPNAVSAPRFVPFDASAPVNVRTETYNSPLVMSPGEVEHFVNVLTNDMDTLADADETAERDFVELARSFARAWREVWSEHGMKPSGWPLYHALLSRVDQALNLINPDLIVASNGVELRRAFRGLVVFSAINEEFAPLYLDKDDVPGRVAQELPQSATGKSAQTGVPAGNIGRNDPCHCGSGRRFKHCHGKVS